MNSKTPRRRPRGIREIDEKRGGVRNRKNIPFTRGGSGGLKGE